MMLSRISTELMLTGTDSDSDDCLCAHSCVDSCYYVSMATVVIVRRDYEFEQKFMTP